MHIDMVWGSRVRQPAGKMTLLAVLLLCSGQVWANPVQQTLSAVASEEYVTNPLMKPAGQGSSAWRTTIEPRYMLSKAFDTDSLQARMDLQLVRSSNTTLIANRNNPTMSLDWLHSNERGSFGATATYSKASTLMTEPSTIGLVSSSTTTGTRNLSANWSRAFSSRSTLALNGGYTKTTYDGASAGTNLSDYSSRTAGVKFSYTLTEHSVSFVNVGYTDSRSGGRGTTRQYSTMLGLNWTVSEQLDWALQAGSSKLVGNGGGTSLQGEATMNYRGERTWFSVSANRKVAPSGLGAFIRTDGVNGKLSYDMNERSRAGLDLGWHKSAYLSGSLYRSAGVWMHHDFNQYWGLKIYLQHSTNSQVALGPASSNTLGLSISCSRF